MATNNFSKTPVNLDSPAQGSETITPNDNADLTTATRAIWVGVAGDLAVVMVGGQTQVWPNAFGWMPISATRVLKTGTVAAGLVGAW